MVWGRKPNKEVKKGKKFFISSLHGSRKYHLLLKELPFMTTGNYIQGKNNLG